MSDLSELGEILHEQHFRILILISGLENRIRGKEAARPLETSNEIDRALLEELIASLPDAIEHNAFEEKVLFPLLCRHGEGELADILSHEHRSIGPTLRRVQVLASELLMNGCDDAHWQEFRQEAEMLVSEMHIHLEKEEMNVVQRLDFFLDAETDRKLARSFASGTGHPELQTVAVPAVEPMPLPIPLDPVLLAPVAIAASAGGTPSAYWSPRRVSASSAANLAARRRSTSPRHP